MLGFFISTEKKFFPLFEKASTNLVSMSEVLTDLVSSNTIERQQSLTKQLENLKLEGQSISQYTISELSINYIAPFYREDIYDLVRSINSIADSIYVAAKRMCLYKLEIFTPEIIKLIELIRQSVKAVNAAVSGLSNLKTNKEHIQKAIVNLNDFKRAADKVFDDALAYLLEAETNPISLLKIKEIMQVLLKTNDKTNHGAAVIRGILLKYS